LSESFFYPSQGSTERLKHAYAIHRKKTQKDHDSSDDKYLHGVLLW